MAGDCISYYVDGTWLGSGPELLVHVNESIFVPHRTTHSLRAFVLRQDEQFNDPRQAASHRAAASSRGRELANGRCPFDGYKCYLAESIVTVRTPWHHAADIDAADVLAEYGCAGGHSDECLMRGRGVDGRARAWPPRVYGLASSLNSSALAPAEPPYILSPPAIISVKVSAIFGRPRPRLTAAHRPRKTGSVPVTCGAGWSAEPAATPAMPASVRAGREAVARGRLPRALLAWPCALLVQRGGAPTATHAHAQARRRARRRGTRPCAILAWLKPAGGPELRRCPRGRRLTRAMGSA